ncbi:hypothetical protein HYDPIDRAFT_172008 [Hydnomerulius pinastri MD-312]|nr:hypothetical protein HYDPIDRAFT_172008 [Hydnomerulius pinastri MD-312]
MPTSELSDALNPHYAQSRSRSSHASSSNQRYPPISQPTVQQHVPHRSELESAIAEPPRQLASPPTPSLTGTPRSSHNPPSGGVHAVQELIRFLASTREAHEIERKRRIAWEQEQEARYVLRQAEMERRMLEMRQEITALKARVAFSSLAGGSSSASLSSTNTVAPEPAPEPAPYPHPSPPHIERQQPTPTTSPALSHTSTPNYVSSPAITSATQPVAGPSSHSAPDATVASASTSHLPSPSLPPARFINVDPSSSSQNTRKRSVFESETEEEFSSEDSSLPPAQRLRRKNHHDTRCLTIQHVMRNHLLRVMQLESDKYLPDSHEEGTTLGPDEPVRFVWDKTPKQSVHNGRMKERVLHDLKASRGLYKHVPDKEFGKKSLDSVFDQAFVTLRQKFKAQRDASVAKSHKQREDTKALRARRLSRRKLKLSNRSDARNKMEMFEHVTFDGALQIECMSSEESEVEEDSASGSRSTLRIRGFPWRSLRLQHFFDILDEGDKHNNAQRPRRGVGRKERYAGPPKEGFILPPHGVASWMISKRWMSMMQISHAEVLGMLKNIIVDPGGFDWNQFHALGEESEDERWLEMGHHVPHPTQNTLHYSLQPDGTGIPAATSSSLQNALSHHVA